MNARGGRVGWLAFVCFAGLVAMSSARALTPEGSQRSAERASIATARSEANARFAAQTKACQARFVVTSCVNEASKVHRLAIAELHERDLGLNDADRREAAELRRRAIDAKAAAAEPRASEAPTVRIDTPRARPAPNPAATREPATPQALADERNKRRSNEERNQAAYDAKVRAAEEHREAVLRRNAERAASGRSSKPLPLPGQAASAP